MSKFSAEVKDRAFQLGAIGMAAGIGGLCVFSVYSCEKDRRAEEQQILNQGFDVAEWHPLSATVDVWAGKCELNLDYHDSRYERPIHLVYSTANQSFSITKPEQLRSLAPEECYAK